MKVQICTLSLAVLVTCSSLAEAQGGDIVAGGAVKPLEIRDISGGPFFEMCSAGSAIRIINADGSVVCEVDDTGGSGDNLGNHTATQNINLGLNWLSGDGTSEGIQVDSVGNVLFSGDLEIDDGGLRIFKSGSDLRLEAEATSNSDFEVNANDIILLTADNGIFLEPGGLGTAVRVNNGTPSDSTVSLVVGGRLEVEGFAPGASTTVCRTSNNVLADCSSSLALKEAVSEIPWGIETVEQMRPVQFRWKGHGEQDFGFIAEDMAAIDPRFVTYADDGTLIGVKYRQLVAVLAQALKEQQAQIEELRVLLDTRSAREESDARR